MYWREFLLCAGLAATMTAIAQVKITADPRLDAAVSEAAHAAAEAFKERNLKLEELAITLVGLRNPDAPRVGSHRGQQPIYPASVIKLFYLEAAHRWIEEGRVADTPELRRAMSDMIVHSYNEPTHYIVDLLTGTTGGPELPPAEMAAWGEKRNAINRYFAGRGFTGINVNQKPWCEGPYGRERIWVGQNLTNRNMLTTEATARLLTEIVLGNAVSAERSQQMMELLKRDPFKEGATDGQARFTGPALPPGAKLWSKAGWTSQTRHDAAFVELPSGARFVLVTFTVNHANEHGIIPLVAQRLIDWFAGNGPHP